MLRPIYLRAASLAALTALAACASPAAQTSPQAAATAPATQTEPALRFSVPEGGARNEFYRAGPIAAHLTLKPGIDPRLVVAFPAGNSGVALWFARAAEPVAWGPVTAVEGVSRAVDGGTLHGITAEVTAEAPALTVEQALLSNVRVLRDYGYAGTVPEGIATPARVERNTVTWSRRRLDGGPGYLLAIEVLAGGVEGGGGAPVRFTAPSGSPLRLRVTALSGDPPLTPILQEALLTPAAAQDERLRNILAFLSYEEALLAGSWRFNTYFGRDTLMSLRLLGDALAPQGFEAGLGSVLERLNAAGEVAHEEDVGEFAVLQRRRAGEAGSDTPVFDYKMVDDDFMLAPVAAYYLLDGAGRERAAEFLAQRTASGESYGAALVRNLRFVLEQARPFAAAPSARTLISLKPGFVTGEWRDSEEGLGGGRYAYNVNGVLVPAALRAIDRLAASGLLKPYAEAGLSDAGALAAVWDRAAPRLFDVTVPEAQARASVAAHARAAGVPAEPAVATLPDGSVCFPALALEADGKPIPVMHSDIGFALLLSEPAPAELDQMVRTAMRPFPAGLMTGAGLVVANPAYASPERWPTFANTQYHGAVVWSWHQAMLAEGLKRQLGRTDLPPATRTVLERAQAELWDVIRATDEVRNAELWSWSYNGRYTVVPYGQRGADQTESNAAQLWSTVYLGVRPPAGR